MFSSEVEGDSAVNENAGTLLARSLTVKILSSASFSPEKAVIATAVVCNEVSRRCAVTTTSSSPSAVCARAGIAAAAESMVATAYATDGPLRADWRMRSSVI
jgi:hypothetical protein